MDGYIKLYRKLLSNPIATKDSEHLAIWIYLLLNATHKEMNAMFNGKKIILKPGQLITGTRTIANDLKINKDKVQRVLNEFKSDTQIDTLASRNGRLITILNWGKYQKCDTQIDTQNDTRLIHDCDTTDTRLIHNKNVKNERNIYVCNNSAHARAREGIFKCHLGLTEKEDNCISCLKKNICPLQTSNRFLINHNCTFEEWLRKKNEFAKNVIVADVEVVDVLDYDYLEEE